VTDTGYILIRSGRKTLSLSVRPDGTAEVHAPYRMPVSEIDAFVRSKADWLAKVRAKLASTAEMAAEAYSREDLRRMAKELKTALPGLLDRYARLLGVSYGRVAIRCQKTRWGSCSSKGNLNFNCLLAEAPDSVLAYVVAHELCHRKEMNHSKRFWALVAGVCPSYKDSVRWLKTEGQVLQAKVPRG